MTHQDISVDDYHEGDAIELPVIVEDQDGTRLDITGATVEWLLKNDAHDPDEEALLTKTSSETDEVEITDAEEGEAVVYIDTGDTDDILPTGELAVDSETFHHRARVTDAEGRRSTIFHGTFTIHV